MIRSAPRWLCALALAVPAPPAPAQEAQALADNLVRLRAEIEQLNSELDLAREEARTTLAGLAAQRTELSAQLDRQALASREQAQRLAQAQETLAEAGVEGAELRPVLVEALAGLEAHVRASLPFKQDERLAALAALRERIVADAVPPHRAANQVWAFVEDELRLTRENGLFSQTIELDGERVLADIAKVGTVMLYFRTSQGDYGLIARQGDGWRWQRAPGRAEGDRIAALFDAYRKQIRQGWFELPMAAAGGAP